MKNTQRINSKTKIFGILGYPLSHTLSPLIHNGLFKEYDFNGIYLVFEHKEPQTLINSLFETLRVKGLSVTIPHKEWAYSAASHKDQASTVMRAANTLVAKEDGIYAYNTDGEGAIRSILRYFPGFFSSGKEGDVLILGSGGSARGISYSLLKHIGSNRKIAISARNANHANSIVQLLNENQPRSSYFLPLDEVYLRNEAFSLVINTTPIGMKGNSDSQILDEKFFLRSHILFDIVYNPLKTPLVKAALKQKVYSIPGYEMLIYQAMEQFRHFTGIFPEEANVEKVRKWLLKHLKARSSG
jgi:shikimate dehydrogenase